MKAASYHLRIFTLGAVGLGIICVVLYLMMQLPFWVSEAPLLVMMAYMIGKILELWAKS